MDSSEIVQHQTLADLRKLMMGALFLASLFGALVGYASAMYRYADEFPNRACETDTECETACGIEEESK